MPDISFAPENKTSSVFDMDKLSLKFKETARICIIDEKPKMRLVHWILHRVGKDGKPAGGYFACLGDYDTVMRAGKDSEHCPACAIAMPGKDVRCTMPRRRFVMHIGRYRTNQQGDPIEPYMLALQAFVFSDDKFSKLVDRAQEHGDLRKKDIRVTCTSEQYQQYDFDVSPRVLWMEKEKGKIAFGQRKEIEAKKNAQIEMLLCTVLTHDQLEKICAEANPGQIGKTDSDNLDGAVSAGVDDNLNLEALKALGIDGAADTATDGVAERPGDVVFDHNDRDAALPPIQAEAEVDFSSFLQGEEDLLK